MGPLGIVAGAAGAVLAARALHRWNRAAVADAERRYPPAGSFLTAAGIRLHYIDRGPAGADPVVPVVLLHGAAGTLHDFDYVVDALAEQFRVIVFDRPGHGYSDALPADSDTAEVQSGMLADALAQLGVERPVLVGYSWGAALALRYAFDHSDDTGALVLIGGTTHIGTAPRNPLYWILRTPYASEALLRFGLVPIGRPYIGVPLAKVFAPDSAPRDYLERARAMWVRPAPVRAMTRDFHGLAAELRVLRPRYPELRVPVVAVAGDRDRLVDHKRNSLAFAREAPDTEMILVPGAGHGLPQVRPDAVIQAIRRAAARREG